MNFIQKGLEMCKSEKNIENESLETFRNRSDFGACYYNSWQWQERKKFSPRSCCSFFVVLQKNLFFGIVFWLIKNRAINFNFQL